MRLAARRRAHGFEIAGKGLGEATYRRLGRDGVEVACLGDGDPIVLVAGLAGGRHLLAPLARRLSRRHKVVLYNLRGDEARWEFCRERSVSEYADDLAEVLDHLRLERPAVLGVSFGGAVALELAVERPQRLGALAVYGAESRFPPSVGSQIARRVLERFPLPNDNPFLNQFFNLLHGRKPEPGPLVDFIVERCWETDQAVIASRLRARFEAFDVSDRLWRVDVPTLVVAGGLDVIVPASRQRALADGISGARFETVAGAGHVGFLTHADEVARHVRSLIRSGQRVHH